MRNYHKTLELDNNIRWAPRAWNCSLGFTFMFDDGNMRIFGFCSGLLNQEEDARKLLCTFIVLTTGRPPMRDNMSWRARAALMCARPVCTRGSFQSVSENKKLEEV